MAVKRWNGTSWEIYAGSDLAPVKVTDGRVGKTTFIGATTPTGMVDGDIWIDQDTATNAVVPTALLAKGDIFVATASGAYTRLAAGNNGESLYADSSTSTGLRWQGDYNVGKNKFLNGDFSIWQRGTTFNSVSTDTYQADRFTPYVGGGSVTVTRETFTPGLAPSAGYEAQYFARFSTTNNAGSAFRQRIEDVRTLAGQTATLSFWAKSNTNITIATGLYQVFGSGGSTYTLTSSPAATVTNSWQRFSFVFNVPSVLNKTIGSGSYLQVDISLPPGSYNFDTWGWQLEAGSVATPFTTNTGNPQAELAACQRYYQRWNEDQPYTAFLMGGTNSASTVMLGAPLQVHMRTTPAFNTVNTYVYVVNNIQSIGSYTNRNSRSTISLIANGTTTFASGVHARLEGQGSSNGYIELSAEL